jgi:hypothetical protein
VVALAAVALGLALGWASGGATRGLEALKLRFEVPVIALFVVQAVARGRVAGARATSFGLGLWALSCVVLLILLVPDWRRPGIWIAEMGIGINLMVVLVNGAMPVFLPPSAAVASASMSVARSLGFYQLAGPGTVAGMLGDVLQCSFWRFHALVSAGDVLLAVGVTVLIAASMLDSPTTTETAEG